MENFKRILLAVTILSSLWGCNNGLKVMEKDFADVVNEALADGKTIINIPKGIYYMELKGGEPLTLEGLKDIEINANGSQIITKKASLAIQINNCENIKLSGFSIDCDPIPFTQGTITDVAPDGLWWEFEIMEGYSAKGLEDKIPDRIQIFNPETLTLRKNLYTFGNNELSSIEKKGEKLFRFTQKESASHLKVTKGDYVVMTINTSPDTKAHSIVSYKSKNIHMEDITLYSGNCFGFFEDQCESNVYNRCVIKKNLDDSKVSFPRLRSINADALHSKGAVVGPTVTNCDFQFHGDDCIAINTSFYRVISTKGNTVDIIAHLNRVKIKEGDNLRFVYFSGAIAGEAKVTKLEETTDFLQKDLEDVFEKYSYIKDRSRQPNVLRLTLDKPVDVDNGGVVSSLTRGGNGFVIKDNILGHTRARGILIKSSDGIISGNKVIGCELSGIILAPELQWMEAGFSHNIIIENNTISDGMFANSEYGIEQAAPISVVAINALDEVVPAGGFRNITIRNNTIENSPKPAMILTSIIGGTVEGNTIKISKDVVRSHGKILKIDSEEAIWTKNNENLIINNNTIIE